MLKDIKIGSRWVGKDHPVYIIAEAGVNHNGDVELALELVREARRIGADCVKFQTFKAASVVTKEAPKAKYQLEVTDQKESQFEMLKKLELELSDYQRILDECEKEEIDFMSTPYSKSDADFLENLNVSSYKIASGQLIETSFLKYLAELGKPLILSTGMGTGDEVSQAIKVIKESGNDKLVLLQCTTNYPSAISDANVRAMESMGNDYDVLVGYSDHVPSNYAAYASVALGACIIEKHFTLDNDMEGPDHKASLNPKDFEEFINGIRSVEASLGSAVKKPTPIEVENAKGMRRSIVFASNLNVGHEVNERDFEFKRPATGMKPDKIYDLVGLKLKMDVLKDEFVRPEHFEK